MQLIIQQNNSLHFIITNLSDPNFDTEQDINGEYELIINIKEILVAISQSYFNTSDLVIE